MNKKKFLLWSFLIFVFTIPLNSFVSVRILIVVLVLSFFSDVPSFNILFLLRKSWDNLIYILVLIVGLCYSNELGTSIKALETSFSLVAIPVVFNKFQNIDERNLNKIIYFFMQYSF